MRIARTATSPGSIGILVTQANDLLAFTKRLIKLRQSYPALHRSRFLTGQHDAELNVKDVTWINADGKEMQDADWGERLDEMLRDVARRTRPENRHQAARARTRPF